ncbi:MAG: acyl-CoA dehydrogenase family protein [Chloroflexota bacterium]|nr:acyl-CoA dehydrogenase family protein [Chloroflexota bacterium]
MDFSWTEEQKMWRQTVRDFAQKEIKPIVREMDTKGEIPEEIVKGMARLGLLGLTASEKYGGAEADWTMSCIAAEELARADISIAIPVFYLVEAGWGFIFNRYGTEEAKAEFLPKVTRGEAVLGIATTESGGGSDILGALKTRARKEGDEWVLNGEKTFTSGIAESLKLGGIHLTLARTDPEAGHKGFSFFAVPLKDNPGISTTLFEDWGRTGISTGGFSMKDVRLPEHYLVGEEGKGFYYAMEGFSAARLLIGATCIGAAEAGLEMGTEYIKEREAFGRPIASYEGIQFPLVERYTDIEATKLIVYKAAWMMDKMYQEGEFTSFDIAKITAMAKLRAPVQAFDTLNEVANWLGALAYTKEHPIEMGIRGVRSYSIGAEGTQNIMRLIIARELLGSEFLPYKR